MPTKKIPKSAFKSITKETPQTQLKITGAFPDWLSGTLLRNGPAKFDLKKGCYRHWFDGLGLLHKFELQNGQVTYQNKFIESETYKENISTQKVTHRAFATDPCGGIFKRFFTGWFKKFTDNPNINISKIPGPEEKFIAMTEAAIPIEFNPDTLETIGKFKFKDNQNADISTAHPHYDPKRQATYNIQTKFGMKSSESIILIKNNTQARTPIAKTKTTAPSYHHSFGMSENHIIRTDIPFKIGPPLKYIFGSKTLIENYHWQPKENTLISIFEKDTGKCINQVKAPPFFTFHHVNAFEENDTIVLDLITYKDATIIESLYLKKLRSQEIDPNFPDTELTRLHLSLTQTTPLKTETLYTNIELPRINYATKNTKRYNNLYAIGTDKDNFFDHIVKLNLNNKKAPQIWRKDHHFPSEPVFIENPTPNSEDDGIIASIVLDGSTNTSYLLILDAKTMTEQATATLPEALPVTLHGNFYT